MNAEQQKLAFELIHNPLPGSDLERAKQGGVDLTLLVENLRSSVGDRLRKLYAVATFMEKLRDQNSRS